MPAITSTTANRRWIINTGSFRLPRNDPAKPPQTTAAARGQASSGNARVLMRCPERPAAEFTRMNSAETAAALRVRAQP